MDMARNEIHQRKIEKAMLHLLEAILEQTKEKVKYGD